MKKELEAVKRFERNRAISKVLRFGRTYDIDPTLIAALAKQIKGKNEEPS